jgi:hypothetical protein
MNKLSVLMTVYNEADFVEYAIKSCLEYVDHLVIVEGAYQETIRLGASPRSTDGTRKKIFDMFRFKQEPQTEEDPTVRYSTDKVFYIEANGETDKDQRNVGLQKIKELNPDGWFMIIDGDEVYEPSVFHMIKSATRTMERTNKYGAYFKSLTFVNDPNHYTEQEFPRLFRITPEAKFSNDNFLEWPDKKLSWTLPHVIKIPYIRFFHYSFCKSKERFELKKKWWETRFGGTFDYGWHINEEGKIEDPNHEIYEYKSNHPTVMKDHPRWKEVCSTESE